MIEMMVDLETLDTRSSAVVLSIGAVTFEMSSRIIESTGKITLDYRIVERFYRVLDIGEQLQGGRTVSQSTLLWWMAQSLNARDEAFTPVRRDVRVVMHELQQFVTSHKVPGAGINKFWASPVGFDFGIWNSLAEDMNHSTPWSYRQVYDVRTVLNEASYSAKDHLLSRVIPGEPHLPVFDCEVQIDELAAARNKIGRRIG